jgi:glycosyltransferase involved in cell wall biosynthesis
VQASETGMSSILVSLISHNELSKRGEAVLRRALDSLTRAMDHVARHRPGLDVYVGCCDDASSDATPDHIDTYFKGKSWFKLVRNRTNHYIGFTRNVAASQFDTDAICMLDADDEYRETHLLVAAEIMDDVRDNLGRKLLAASTTAELSTEVHPDWLPRISATVPITKVIRRIAWDFVEGMPMEAIYRTTGCDDQFLVQKLGAFFNVPLFQNVTAKYWNYPGSFFDRQLYRFRRPAAEHNLAQELPVDQVNLHALREQQERAFLDYLRAKRIVGGWQRLEEYSVRPP